MMGEDGLRLWKITRRWYVRAATSTDAIEQAVPGDHVDVHAQVLEPAREPEGATATAARLGVDREVVVQAREVLAGGELWKDVAPEAGDPLADAVVAQLLPWLQRVESPVKATLRLTLREDNTVEVWLDAGLPGTQLAVKLRQIADGFDRRPRRIE